MSLREQNPNASERFRMDQLRFPEGSSYMRDIRESARQFGAHGWVYTRDVIVDRIVFGIGRVRPILRYYWPIS